MGDAAENIRPDRRQRIDFDLRRFTVGRQTSRSEPGAERLIPFVTPLLLRLNKRRRQTLGNDLLQRQGNRLHLGAQAGELKVAQRLELTADADRHLMSGRIEVTERELHQRSAIGVRIARHVVDQRVADLAGAQVHVRPILLSNWPQHRPKARLLAKKREAVGLLDIEAPQARKRLTSRTRHGRLVTEVEGHNGDSDRNRESCCPPIPSEQSGADGGVRGRHHRASGAALYWVVVALVDDAVEADLAEPSRRLGGRRRSANCSPWLCSGRAFRRALSPRARRRARSEALSGGRRCRGTVRQAGRRTTGPHGVLSACPVDRDLCLCPAP